MVALVKMVLITKLNLILFDYFDFPERSWNVCTDCNGYFGCTIAEITINSFSTLMSKFIAFVQLGPSPKPKQSTKFTVDTTHLKLF